MIGRGGESFASPLLIARVNSPLTTLSVRARSPLTTLSVRASSPLSAHTADIPPIWRRHLNQNRNVFPDFRFRPTPDVDRSQPRYAVFAVTRHVFGF